MKKKLTPAQLAALAAGATLEEVVASADLSAPDADSEDTSEAELAGLNEQVLLLTGELAALKATSAEQETKLAAAEADLATANASLTASTEAATAMTDTIMARVKNMGIALNASVPEACADSVELVKLHASLDAQFKEKFKTRAVATGPKVEDKPKPMWTEAQLAAARAITIY